METDALSLEGNMPSHPENHHHYKQCQILIKIFQFKETQKKKWKFLTNQCSIPQNFLKVAKSIVGREKLINPRQNSSQKIFIFTVIHRCPGQGIICNWYGMNVMGSVIWSGESEREEKRELNL